MTNGKIKSFLSAAREWAKKMNEELNPKPPRPFLKGDNVEWLAPGGTFDGVVISAASEGCDYVFVSLSGRIVTFTGDGRMIATGGAESSVTLFHIEQTTNHE